MGAFHTHHCEDFLVSFPISSKEQVIAVMDGCSMGKESVFASMLIGKTLRHIGKNWYYLDWHKADNRSISEKIEALFRELLTSLKTTQNQLGLETQELLATLMLAVVNLEEHCAETICVGDGLLCVDGTFTDYDQKDKPDYLGYHLHEDFDTWWSGQDQKCSISHFKDLSLCTDGIFSFKNLANTQETKNAEEFAQHLLVDKYCSEQENFLNRKLIKIERSWSHVPTDDLGIVRILL